MFLMAFIALYLSKSAPAYPGVPAFIDTFEACAAAGYPVGESYPRQCFVPNGPSFTEVIPPQGENEVACTLDAKLCPDGSAVGRSGPNCEFAPCPGENIDKS